MLIRVCLGVMAFFSILAILWGIFVGISECKKHNLNVTPHNIMLAAEYSGVFNVLFAVFVLGSLCIISFFSFIIIESL